MTQARQETNRQVGGQEASLDLQNVSIPTKVAADRHRGLPDREEPYRGEVPVSFPGLGSIIPAYSHIQVVEQGLQLWQGKAVILPIAVHEIFQERGGAEGWHGSGGGVSLGDRPPHTKQHQEEAAREGWVQGLHGDQVHLEEHKAR